MLERNRIKDILISVMTIAMIVIGVVLYASKNPKNNAPQAILKEQTVTTQPEPKKTDFGTSMPTDFPTDIPIEKGVQVEQSYGLNYVNQKQLTIVFFSTKTVAANYTLYADFLKKQSWNVLNKYESASVSSLYGTKGNNDINVTISENTSATSTKSQVSISVLNK